jgi:hypothetical protein
MNCDVVCFATGRLRAGLATSQRIAQDAEVRDIARSPLLAYLVQVVKLGD